MYTFPETHKPVKLTQEATDNLNSPILWNQLTSSSSTPDQKKNPLGSNSFTSEFYQTYKDEIIWILNKPFQKTEQEQILPNSFYEARITLIAKLKRQYKGNKLYQYPSLSRCKIS